MKDNDNINEQLVDELKDLRKKLAELETLKDSQKQIQQELQKTKPGNLPKGFTSFRL